MPGRPPCPRFRGRANRRVAYVTSGSQKAVQPPLELPCVKSCAPIGASSKDSGLLPVPLGVALSKRVYSPQRGRLLSCQVARVPAPVSRIFRQVYPSPFPSMEGSGSSRFAPFSTYLTVTSSWPVG